MSIFEEEAPRKVPAHQVGQDISLLSVDELAQRIALLNEEIARLEAERAARGRTLSAAEALFRK